MTDNNTVAAAIENFGKRALGDVRHRRPSIRTPTKLRLRAFFFAYIVPVLHSVTHA
jgi:hypothetical protein